VSRGRAQRSKDLIKAAHKILSEIQPTTVRSVCYQLFIAGAIGSMRKSETDKVSRLLTLARKSNEIPWEWIVDETRSIERPSAWNDPEGFARSVIRSYRRDYWSQQPRLIEVWSEKGTVRGTLAPVLDKYGVGFRVMHGYTSTTVMRDIAEETEDDSAPLLAFYIGDRDPSGLHMSEADLPQRLEDFGASVDLTRIALTHVDITNSGLPDFAAETKKGDTRYRWFVERYGDRCFELDAIDPNVLRDRVERAIQEQIDHAAWRRCQIVERAERRSLTEVITSWGQSSVDGDAPP
jgi:hypothetical protein